MLDLLHFGHRHRTLKTASCLNYAIKFNTYFILFYLFRFEPENRRT